MPWCPNCNEEYIDGIEKCPECGSELSKAPNDESNYNTDNGGEKHVTEHLEEKLLFTVENEVQFALITDALRKENIPFALSAQKLWDHMQIIYAKTVVGEEVYVAEEDYAKTKDIYDYFEAVKNSNTDEGEE